MAAVAAGKAAVGQMAVSLNIDAIRGLAFQIFGVIVLFIAAGILLGTKKKVSEHMSTVLIVIIAGAVAIGGVALIKFGGSLADLVIS